MKLLVKASRECKQTEVDVRVKMTKDTWW